MPFVTYTPTVTRLTTLSEADGSERLKAATTNVSLEQLADGILWLDENTIHTDGGAIVGDLTVSGNVDVGDTLSADVITSSNGVAAAGDVTAGGGVTATGNVNTGGAVHFTGAQPASNADPGARNTYDTNQVKVWGRIINDGIGGVTVSDGYNIASVSIVGTTAIDITFARAFANVHYAPTVTSITTGQARVCIVDSSASTTNAVRVRIYDVSSPSTPIDPGSATLIAISLIICGRQ